MFAQKKYEEPVSLVRVIYIIPSDAEPWPEAKDRATDVLEDLRWFFADEMFRLGHGRQTFDIAREADGSLLFHQIDSPLRKEEFIEANRKKYPAICRRAAKTYGLCDNTFVTIYFIEAYSIIDGVVHANCGGWARNGGEAFLSSLHLKMARREWIANDSEYGGEIFDWISSEPMRGDTLSWHKRGKKLGDVSGSAFGVMAHELGHCFGLCHEMAGERNRKGNLMDLGFRGMRGYFRPDLTDDFCVLHERSAVLLDSNAFFAVRKLKPKSISFLDETSK